MENPQARGPSRDNHEERLSAETKGRKLREASGSKRSELVEKWLRLGADPNRQDDRTGLSALALALKAGDVESTRILLSAGARDIHNNDGESCFVMALMGSAAAALLLAAAGGFDLSGKSSRGETALMLACAKASHAHRLASHAHRLAPEAAGGVEEQAKRVAERAAALDAMKLALSLPSANVKEANSAGRTALMRAARQCGREALSLIVGESDVKHADHQGMTALMCAASCLNWEAVEMLLPLSNLDAVDQDGWSAEKFALKSYRDHGPAFAKRLREYGEALKEAAVLAEASPADSGQARPPARLRI